jgi:hypothetical protein
MQVSHKQRLSALPFVHVVSFRDITLSSWMYIIAAKLERPVQ